MNNSNSGGIGIGGLLMVVFIVLKLTNVIFWSWWWVLSPVLIPLGLMGVILVFWMIYGGITLFKIYLDKQ